MGTRSCRNTGFTLIETALVIVIVGVGVLALMQLLAVGTEANGRASELSTAITLANNIRERTVPMTFDQIEDLDGASHSPPIDAAGTSLGTFNGWTQAVSVRRCDAENLGSSTATGTDPVARVVVTVSHNGQDVYAADWIAVEAD